MKNKISILLITVAIIASCGTKTAKKEETKSPFPKDFLWGAASAAYQVEGGTNADGRTPNTWDKLIGEPYKIVKKFTGLDENADIAINQYDRTQFVKDVQLMKELGINSYRFSLSWSRIMPDGTGKVNEAGVDYYNFVINSLLKEGIEPLVTLNHFEMPVVLADKGGWKNRESVKWFGEFAGVCFDKFGDRIKLFLTFNEPAVELLFMKPFFEAAQNNRPLEFPASEEFIANNFAQIHHLILAHATAVNIYKQKNLKGKIGITYNYTVCKLDSTTTENGPKSLEMISKVWNDLYISPVFKGEYPQDVFERLNGAKNADIQPGDMEMLKATKTDFIGINYYGVGIYKENTDSKFFGLEMGKNPDNPPMFNGYVDPDAFRDLLIDIKNKYNNPEVIITENGAGYGPIDDTLTNGEVNDSLRTSYIKRHIAAMQQAIEQGVNVKGYFVWSMFDNFEWMMGYTRRFGITYVDFATQQRTPKMSYKWYQSFLKTTK